MLNQIFISEAMAQNAENASPLDQVANFMPLILIFGVFYFFIIRPQSKKYKDHQIMINNLKSGDEVVTTGGIVGTIKSTNQTDGLFEIEIAQGVVIKVQKNNVAMLAGAAAQNAVVKTGKKK